MTRQEVERGREVEIETDLFFFCFSCWSKTTFSPGFSLVLWAFEGLPGFPGGNRLKMLWVAIRLLVDRGSPADDGEVVQMIDSMKETMKKEQDDRVGSGAGADPSDKKGKHNRDSQKPIMHFS